MPQQDSATTGQWWLMGLLVVATLVLTGRQHHGEAHDEANDGAQHQTNKACRGFVVLPNGFAVLSGLSAAPAHGSARVPHGATHVGATMADKSPTAGAPQHLMGYT